MELLSAQNHHKLYQYIILSEDGRESITWTSTSPPAELKRNIGHLLMQIQARLASLESVSVPSDDQLTHGCDTDPERASTLPVILTVSASKNDLRSQVKENEHLEFGRSIITAYHALQSKRLAMERQIRFCANRPDGIQERLSQVIEKLAWVESAVAGTGELEQVFDLWVRKQCTKYKGAMEIHVSERTWARRCREVACHLAHELSQNLTAEQLNSLLGEVETPTASG